MLSSPRNMLLYSLFRPRRPVFPASGPDPVSSVSFRRCPVFFSRFLCLLISIGGCPSERFGNYRIVPGRGRFRHPFDRYFGNVSAVLVFFLFLFIIFHVSVNKDLISHVRGFDAELVVVNAVRDESALLAHAAVRSKHFGAAFQRMLIHSFHIYCQRIVVGKIQDTALRARLLDNFFHIPAA